MICSVLAAWGGIFQALRVHSALPTVGQGYELQAIAAAVIGGAALFGGFGSILGPIVGVFVIRILDNGLVMTRIDANYFKLAIGSLTILAVIFNVIVRRRAQRMRPRGRGRARGGPVSPARRIARFASARRGSLTRQRATSGSAFPAGW